MARPNILLIYTDQQRHDTIASLGNLAIRTPALDRLVAEGVAFTHATTPCPVCMPARWSLHTGQYTTTHRCYSNHHPGPRPAFDLPRLLRAAGYRTGLAGKNHSFLQPADLDYWQEHPQPPESPTAAERRAWLQAARERNPRLVEEPVPGGVHLDDEHAVTDAGLRFIEGCRGEPFFLWLSYLYPHTPYMAPEPYFSQYAGADIPGPYVEASGLEAAGKPFRQRFHRDNNDALLLFTAERVTQMRQVYYGMISLIDAEIGRVLQYLEERGLGENTLIIFSSDHGDYMGDHGLLTKSPSLYDCLVRVPFIVCWPGRVDAGRRDPRFACHVDILPTLAEAAGVPVPAGVQGVSLLPFLCDGGREGAIRGAGYSEYGVPGRPYDPARLAAEGLPGRRYVNPWDDRLPWEGNPVSLAGRIRTVRTHAWKYVEERGGTCELYDLWNDPHELVNLWNDPRHAGIQAELAAQLAAWQAGLPYSREGIWAQRR